ncbi:hypothetical protein F66182_6171 [Fusarium sp. NRRL 66182]|nr:hypothetical protein F66182_6171 [Fusarium sp. NRRL 66182]
MGSTAQSSNTPSLTLYRLDGSCAFVPHSLLRHFDIPFKAIRLKFGPDGVEAADGSFTHAQYRAIHPRGYVPALAVDNEVITEIPAVLNYISSLVPDENLLGVGPLQRAKVAEWLAFLSGTVHGLGYGPLLRPSRFSDDAAMHDAIRAKGKKLKDESYEAIEKALEGREFAVGQALTVVDFNLYVYARWAKEFDMDVETLYPSLYEHAQRMEKLAGIRETAENEGLALSFT